LVAKESGQLAPDADPNQTLKELFQTFFPDKEYLGVIPLPDGSLSFPVRVKSGQVHDINELSSGEKEVVYGYLRLRNSAPRNSTILIDEPELHLNPGLLRGFPDFYHQHLGRALGNQLWLVTHSDTLLRQAVGNFNYSVYHMASASTDVDIENQAMVVVADDALERATIDLVGDLATYRPKGKVVLFEGGGNTEIDVAITERLFPEFAKRVNLVSAGNKRRVRDLYETLADTAERFGMAERFYAIMDKDSTPFEAPIPGARLLSWDVYHIENYLLVPKYVRAAVEAITMRRPFATDEEVLRALRTAAESLIPQLVLERLQKSVNDRLVNSISVGASPSSTDIAAALQPSITGSFDRLDSVRTEVSDVAQLRVEAVEVESSLQAWLGDGQWISEFPGRSVLQRFAGEYLSGAATYEGFRNVILDKMVDDEYHPRGMETILTGVIGGASVY
jgi:hypothetical protein